MLKYGIDNQLLDIPKILSLPHITIHFTVCTRFPKKIDWTVYFCQKFQDSIKPMMATPLSAEWFISLPDIFLFMIKIINLV